MAGRRAEEDWPHTGAAEEHQEVRSGGHRGQAVTGPALEE